MWPLRSGAETAWSFSTPEQEEDVSPRGGHPNSRYPFPPDLVALGRAVWRLRAERGYTQEHLGFRSRMHRNYVGAIERGEINPTIRVLSRLARGLGVRLSDIVKLYESCLEGDPLPRPTPQDVGWTR